MVNDSLQVWGRGMLSSGMQTTPNAKTGKGSSFPRCAGSTTVNDLTGPHQINPVSVQISIMLE